jgi:hypothetical protein
LPNLPAMFFLAALFMAGIYLSLALKHLHPE